MSGVTVRLALSLFLSQPATMCFPGFLRSSGLTLIWLETRRSLASLRGENERERKHRLSRARTRATAPLTLAAGIRERSSLANLSVSRTTPGIFYLFSLAISHPAFHVAVPRTCLRTIRAIAYGIRITGNWRTKSLGRVICQIKKSLSYDRKNTLLF